LQFYSETGDVDRAISVMMKALEKHAAAITAGGHLLCVVILCRQLVCRTLVSVASSEAIKQYDRLFFSTQKLREA